MTARESSDRGTIENDTVEESMYFVVGVCMEGKPPGDSGTMGRSIFAGVKTLKSRRGFLKIFYGSPGEPALGDHICGGSLHSSGPREGVDISGAGTQGGGATGVNI